MSQGVFETHKISNDAEIVGVDVLEFPALSSLEVREEVLQCHQHLLEPPTQSQSHQEQVKGNTISSRREC